MCTQNQAANNLTAAAALLFEDLTEDEITEKVLYIEKKLKCAISFYVPCGYLLRVIASVFPVLLAFVLPVRRQLLHFIQVLFFHRHGQ